MANIVSSMGRSLVSALGVDKLILITAGKLRSVHAGVHVFAILVKGPVRLIGVVISRNTIDSRNIQAIFAFIAFNQFIFYQRVAHGSASV